MPNETPGPGVDAQGRPVVDPTENVKDLMEASVKRLDDLRTLQTHYQDQILKMMAAHDHEVDALRSYFGKELREAESKRIDAIRAVDIAAVQRAAEVATDQASTLAAQVDRVAETLRAQVEATATAARVQLDAVVAPLKTDIADLRKTQYEQQGQRTQVTEARGSNAAIMASIGLACTLVIVLIAVLGLVLSR